MNKLLAGMAFAFVVLTIISYTVEGAGGLLATRLTSQLTSTATTANVATTEGFLTLDSIRVGSEEIAYTGKTATTFTGLTRGSNDTEAQTHPVGTRVYNRQTSTINQMLGFNIAEAMSTVGIVRTVTLLPGFFSESLPKMISWDYSFFDGTLFTIPLEYFRYLLYPISMGFMIFILSVFINLFFGIARLFT